MSPRRVAGLAGAASLIAVITVISRVLGFGRWLVFSHSVGGTCVGQAYATANQLPNVLYEVAAGGALAAVVVPLVAGALGDGQAERAQRLGAALLTWAVTILVPLGLLLALAARPLAQLLVGSGTPGCARSPEVTAELIRWFAPQIPLYGIGIVLSGLLQARHRFAAAAWAPALSSLVVIAAYLGYGRLAAPSADTLSGAGAWWLAGGTTAGVAALSLPLLVPAMRAGIRLRPTWSISGSDRRRAAALAGGGLLALLAQQASVLVTIWLAQHRGTTGTLNAYNYVQAVYLLPYAVLAVPLATSAFPRLSETGAQQVLVRSMRLCLTLSCLGAALVAAAAPAVGSFFAHLDAGRHTGGGAAMAAIGASLTGYAPGLAGFGVSALALRALYARHQAPAAGAVMALGWGIGVLVPLVACRGRSAHSVLTWLGVGSSTGMLLAGGGLLLLVRRHWGSDTLTQSLRGAVPIALACLVAALAGRVAADLVHRDGMATAIASGLLGGAITLAIVLGFLAVTQRDRLDQLIRRPR